MKNSTYRYGHLSKIVISLLIMLGLFMSCEDDNEIVQIDPTINIIESPNYVSSDSMLSVGESFVIGIQAKSNGHAKLTNLIVFLNGERYLDLGFYKDTYTKEIEITKGLEDTDEWEFVIRDFDGNKASTEMTITKDPNIIYGEINEFLNVQLGAQSSLEYGSFFSFNNGLVYNLENAFHNQEIINLVYFYDDFDAFEENIIASPGANLTGIFGGTYGINNWDTKNTTRFSREKLNVLEIEFDDAKNDSILLANSFAFESGGRKTKFLEPGDMYSFVWENTTGIFKVVSRSGEATGNIIVDMKVQK